MAGSRKFKKLFEPAKIGRMQVKNKIIMPAMTNGYCTEDGYVTQQMIDYYADRAKGGVGLIIVECACVDFPLGAHVIRELVISEDRYIPGLKDLNNAIHRYGAKTAIQIYHAGSIASPAITNLQPVGPSAITRAGCEVPRELNTDEILSIVEQFANAAQRAEKAGFDGVEVHAAHRYLIAQFLSSAWNRRQDIYGGTIQNKARFLLEILHAIRGKVEKSFPIWCRINAEESRIPNGTTIEEAKYLARMLEDFGVDAISVSAYDRDLPASRPAFYPPGWAVHLAAEIKKIVDLPIIAAGRISPELGEKLLQDGKSDFIAIGRGLRADPQLPNKVFSGRLEEIRPCISCSACNEFFRPGGQRLCAVNAAIGREQEYRIRPAKNKKKILIVGGGPAGMEAASVAAQRGHRVEIWEKSNKLGGQLLLAAAISYKADIQKLTNFLVRQVELYGVKVELNKNVSSKLVETYKPDAVIIATGTKPYRPEITGIYNQNVITAEAILDNRKKVGENVIVLGGGMVGCEVAEFLAEKGKKVTIVEMLDRLAIDMTKRQGREILMDLLAERGVLTLTQTKGEEISDKGLIICNKDGQRWTIEGDSIVLACGSMANSSLFEELRRTISEIYAAGDCVKPRSIMEAIDDGSRIGRMV